MGILSRLFGGGNDDQQRREDEQRRGYGQSERVQTTDEQAVARYRYMLQTAPPETIEQAHAESFAKLTPEQRQMVLQGLSQENPEAARVSPNDPNGMARLATRAEINRPGTMERTFGNMGGGRGGMGGGMMGGGMGMGGMIAGSLMGSIAGTFIGSAIAHQFFDNDPGAAEQFGNDGYDANSDGGGDAGGDAGMMDTGGDTGGFEDTGDFGGDFGGDFDA